MSEEKVVPGNVHIWVTDEYGDILPCNKTTFVEEENTLYIHTHTRGCKRDRKRRKHYEKLLRVQKSNRELTKKLARTEADLFIKSFRLRHADKSVNDLRYISSELREGFAVLKGKETTRFMARSYYVAQALGARELLEKSRDALPEGSDLRAVITAFLTNGV